MNERLSDFSVSNLKHEFLLMSGGFNVVNAGKQIAPAHTREMIKHLGSPFVLDVSVPSWKAENPTRGCH